MNRKLLVSMGLGVVVGVIISGAVWLGGSTSSSAAAFGAVNNREDAIKLALQLTGFAEQEGVTAAAKLETLSAADDVPFLRLACRTVWRVKLENLEIIVPVEVSAE